VERCLPAERLEIRIEVCGQSARDFHLTAHGGRYATVIEQLAQRLPNRSAKS
jgi:hypothetical protein